MPNSETPAGSDAENGSGHSEGVSERIEPPRFVGPPRNNIDILKLLTDLEDQVEATPRGPFGTLFRFDEDRFHMTVMKIRANLPEDLKRASRLAREMEQASVDCKQAEQKVLSDAREAARAELERARAEAAQLRDAARLAAAKMTEEAHAEASRMVSDAETDAARMIEDARRTGFGMLDAAQLQAEQAVADSEITARATAHGKQIRSEAEAEAAAIRAGADDYARDVLANLEMVLGKTLQQVQLGREHLNRRPGA